MSNVRVGLGPKRAGHWRASARYFSISFAAMVAVFGGRAFAAPPSEQLLSAPLVSPDSAWTSYGALTVHTVGPAASVPEPLEVAVLAKALGSDRLAPGTAGQITTDEYVRNVYDYVRTNIDVEFRFGLGKGGVGALIDQSGTPLDQADLMKILLAKGGVSSEYKVGTISLTPAQFGKWSGAIKNLNEGAQTFDIDAKSACQFLADGGIPAIVNSATSCDGLSGNLETLVMAHAWIIANGKAYDPAYKVHTFKAGVDVAAAAGCGTAAAPTCGAAAKAAAMTGVTRSTLAGLPTVRNLNETALAAELSEAAVNVQHYIEARPDMLALEDVIGGKARDVSFSPVVGATLPYAATAQYSWAGGVPDQFRTTFTVQYQELTNQVFFADEIAGRRVGVAVDSNKAATPVFTRRIVVEGKLVASALCLNCNTNVGSILFVSVAHPYVALGGAYGDRTVSTAMSTQADSFTIVHDLGAAKPSAQAYYRRLVQSLPNLFVDPVAAAQGPTSCMVEMADISCSNFSQSLFAVQLLVQRTGFDAIAGAVTKTAITRHESIGVAFSPWVKYVGGPEGNTFLALIAGHYEALSIQSSVSVVTTAGADATARSATFATLAQGGVMLEGAIIQQSRDSAEPEAAPFLFAMANRQGQTFVQVPPGSLSAVSGSFTNYGAVRLGRLDAMSAAGMTLVVPTNGDAGCLTWLGANYCFRESGSYGFSSSAVSALVNENLKGGGSTPGMDPLAGAMAVLNQADYSLRKKGSLAVDEASADLTITPPPDIVAGAGEFPYSLPLRRQYRGSSAPITAGSYIYCYCGFVPLGDLTSYTGGDANVSGRFAGGWTHNYQVSAQVGVDSARPFGLTSALDASFMISGALTLYDLNRQAGFDEKLTALLGSYWLGSSFITNSLTIQMPPRAVSFLRLPDGRYNPPAASADSATVTGTRTGPFVSGIGAAYDYSPLSIIYTSSDGQKISFGWSKKTVYRYNVTPHGSIGVLVTEPRFAATSWVFPSGVKIDFQYDQIDTQDGGSSYKVLKSVKNSFGRQLNFVYDPNGVYTISRTGMNITQVNDGGGQSVSYIRQCSSLHSDGNGGCVGYDRFEVVLNSGDRYVYKYQWTGTERVFLDRVGMRLSSIATPTDSVNPYQTVTYDPLWRVSEITDSLGRKDRYYATGFSGGETLVRGQVLDPQSAITTTWFDRLGNSVSKTDQLGRTTRFAYDGAGRRVLTELPEGNSEIKAYDIRSNILSVTQKSKPGSGLADLVATTAYVEGPAVRVCINLRTCNKPATEDGPRTDVSDLTDYSWDAATGDILQILKPEDGDGRRPESSFGYTSYTSNGATFALMTSMTQKIDATAQVTTTFEYDAANRYLLRSAVQDSGGLNLRTCLQYDAIGNLVGVSDPRTTTCPATVQ